MSADYYIVRYKNQEKLIKPSELADNHLGVKLTNKEIVFLKENVFNDIYKKNSEVRPLILRNDKKYGKFAPLKFRLSPF